jgi:hypothetical protein
MLRQRPSGVVSNSRYSAGLGAAIIFREGPKVRILLPPAKSLRIFGSSRNEEDRAWTVPAKQPFRSAGAGGDAERPGTAGIGSPAGKRRRIELQTRIRAEDDPAIARTRKRGAIGCLAEFGDVPRNGNAAVGIVHLDHDVPAALGDGEFCLSVRRGPEPETALASMPTRSSFPTGPISGSTERKRMAVLVLCAD